MYLNCVKRRFLMIKTCSSGPIAYILCCQSEGHISYRLEKFETISTQIDQIKLLLIDFILPAQFEGVYLLDAKRQHLGRAYDRTPPT